MVDEVKAIEARKTRYGQRHAHRQGLWQASDRPSHSLVDRARRQWLGAEERLRYHLGHLSQRLFDQDAQQTLPLMLR